MNKLKSHYRINSSEWQGLSKLGEELSELSVNLFKLIENGGDRNYWGGRDMRKEIMDELADVQATISFFIDNNFTLDEIDYMEDREIEKYEKFVEWTKEEG